MTVVVVELMVSSSDHRQAPHEDQEHGALLFSAQRISLRKGGLSGNPQWIFLPNTYPGSSSIHRASHPLLLVARSPTS